MKLKDLELTSGQWLSLLQKYGVAASSLTGKGAPCPMCGGNDRFTYDNKYGRGNWVCRQCDDGSPAAGDGFALITSVTGMTFRELERELTGPLVQNLKLVDVPLALRTAAGRKDPVAVAKRLNKMWEGAKPLAIDDHVMRYLQSRVPGMNAPVSDALRMGMLEFWQDGKLLGSWPGIVARYVLPDGSLGTLHRTYLDRVKPAKATICDGDGVVLDVKRNDATLNPLSGGAVRLMPSANGEIGVCEGLETAYAAFTMFSVPMWYCLNRVHLAQFEVPHGLGIRKVHVFVDYDRIDQKSGKRPGVQAGDLLAKRLRAQGFDVVIHRPRVEGTDFADEWMELVNGASPDVALRRVAKYRPHLRTPTRVAVHM